MDIPKLEPVYGSTYCTFSVVENKLATLYANQEKIYSVVCALLKKESQNSPHNKRIKQGLKLHARKRTS